MKNILKKIGIIAIIIGVLSPFITLPNVEAATEECDYYLNQYLFLDVFNGAGITTYQVGNGKDIGKRNFTNFIYNFPTLLSGETLEITKHEKVDLSSTNGLKEYYEAYGLFYGDDRVLDRWETIDIDIFGAWVENSNGYENVTTLVHGKWAHDGEDEEDREVQTSVWPDFEDEDDFIEQTIQYAIEESREDVKLDNVLGGASLYEDRNTEYFELAKSTLRSDLETFMEILIYDYNSGSSSATSYTNNYLVQGENNETYFNLNILREIDFSDLKLLKYGYEGKVLSTKEDSIKNSYLALINYNNNGGKCDGIDECYLIDSNNIDIDIQKDYYWPSLYNVEYKVCKQVSNNPTKSWTLTYDRGVNSEEIVNVTKMPTVNPVTGITTTKYTLSSTKPERKDYVFKAWCTEKDGKGTCVEAGKEFVNEKMEDDILYAYWVKPGTEDTEKTGVISYVLGFMGVGLIAYGLYYVISKKNLFKQI